ncbi:hypothetical protein HZH66_005058 [Vespula vulgaris]|uniref:Uncharacterized protein n=1 Tax=Vespula vulgaris TaxID=7454 RepID=A0A834KBM8_VESVU|nr:hypothetical protein HZH66_005058 [Vespula vulgaris]
MSALPKRFASRVAGIYGFVRRLVSTSTTPAVTKTRSFVHLALDGLIIADVVNVATKRAPIKFKLHFFSCFFSDYLDIVIVPEDFVSKDERLERVRRSDFRSYFARGRGTTRNNEEGTLGRQMPGPSERRAISASLWTPFATLRLSVKYLGAVMEKSLT